MERSHWHGSGRLTPQLSICVYRQPASTVFVCIRGTVAYKRVERRLLVACAESNVGAAEFVGTACGPCVLHLSASFRGLLSCRCTKRSQLLRGRKTAAAVCTCVCPQVLMCKRERKTNPRAVHRVKYSQGSRTERERGREESSCLTSLHGRTKAQLVVSQAPCSACRDIWQECGYGYCLLSGDSPPLAVITFFLSASAGHEESWDWIRRRNIINCVCCFFVSQLLSCLLRMDYTQNRVPIGENKFVSK